MSIELVMFSKHLDVFCCPLLLLSSVFPCIRVVSNEFSVHIRRPKYWSFHKDCSLLDSSVHGILQARILEWVAISSSRDLPNPKIKPASPVSPARQVDSLPLSHQGRPFFVQPTTKTAETIKQSRSYLCMLLELPWSEEPPVVSRPFFSCLHIHPEIWEIYLSYQKIPCFPLTILQNNCEKKN